VNKHLMLLLAGTVALLLTTGCKNESPAPEQSAAKPAAETPATAPAAEPAAAPQQAGWTGKVLETMDAAGYTYVQVDTGSEKIWAAAPKFSAKVGDAVVVPKGMAMKNYHSKTLDRDFPVVYFVDAIMVGGADQPLSETPVAAPATAQQKHPDVTSAAPADVDFSGIKPPEGGKTIAELFADTESLAGKPITVRGKVVKYNANIMGKNWLHLQDGTGAEGTNDLTVTSADTAKVGDTVVVTGKLVTDKDFGYGYKYSVIIEDAKVVVE